MWRTGRGNSRPDTIMQIKLTASLATALRTYQAGDVVTMPDGDAVTLIKRGIAMPMRSEKVERTVQSPAEATVIKRRPGRPSKGVL